jgi:hypothetical protein
VGAQQAAAPGLVTITFVTGTASAAPLVVTPRFTG